MIKDDIQKEINKSLKEGKKLELKVLRFIMSQIKYGEIDKRKELSDDEVVTLLQKEIKKRKDAILMFKKGDRYDLVEDETLQLEILNKYLPPQLTESQVDKIIDEILSTQEDKTNIGRLIGLVMSKLKGQVDGSVVASLVKQKLTFH